jgi:hypothetical protein
MGPFRVLLVRLLSPVDSLLLMVRFRRYLLGTDTGAFLKDGYLSAWYP